MSKPWILADFERAIGQLDKAMAVYADNDLLKAGCIQYFEFCFELAWKAIRYISGNLGQPDCLSPKNCLRQAFSNGWIDDESIWLEMLEARNRMSHTYKAERFENIRASGFVSWCTKDAC